MKSFYMLSQVVCLRIANTVLTEVMKKRPGKLLLLKTRFVNSFKMCKYTFSLKNFSVHLNLQSVTSVKIHKHSTVFVYLTNYVSYPASN